MEAPRKHYFSVFTREDDNIPVMPTSQHPSMPNITFNTSGIVSLLKTFKPGKAAGLDDIPTWILKTCAKQVAQVLQVIFTQLFSSGILPNEWLIANIILVFKKGNKSTPANYQSISLIAICYKVMEHIIFHCIMEHLNTHIIHHQS